MTEPKATANTPTEDAQQLTDVRDALPLESTRPQPGKREDDPVLIQIGPLDV